MLALGGPLSLSSNVQKKHIYYHVHIYCVLGGTNVCFYQPPKRAKRAGGFLISNQGFQVVTVVCEKEVTVIECAIGGLQKSGKFTCTGDTFQGCWLLWILMMVHLKSMVSSSYNHCYVQQQSVLQGVFRNVTNSYALVTLLEAVGYCGF